MVNCARFVPKLVVKCIGIAPFSSVILQLTTSSRSILSKLPLSSSRRKSLPSRLFLFFPISFCFSLTTSRGGLPLLVPPTLNASERFVTARDQAFFKTLFFSGDRAGDLGQLKTAAIARFPDDNGFLLNRIWGKTLRDGASSLFDLRWHPNSALCPVRAIEEYVTFARRLGVSLTQGYLLRPTDPKGHVVDRSISSSDAEHRLKLYLKEVPNDAGETLHSFRSGCASF